MTPFHHLSELAVLPIWDGITARRVDGGEMTFSIVELGPGTVVSPHQHPNEQMGVVLRGQLRFTVGDRTGDLYPGDVYAVPGGVPHEVVAGPEGAVVVDVFAPVRDDWARFAPEAPRPCSWP
jgi:quercetin dioxygenase-like cupin family protein